MRCSKVFLSTLTKHFYFIILLNLVMKIERFLNIYFFQFNFFKSSVFEKFIILEVYQDIKGDWNGCRTTMGTFVRKRKKRPYASCSCGILYILQRKLWTLKRKAPRSDIERHLIKPIEIGFRLYLSPKRILYTGAQSI